jgi:lipid A oxidase
LEAAAVAGALAVASGTIGAAPARAEFQLHLYGGLNENFSSTVKLAKDPLRDTRDVSWDGNSFGNAPYWGARATWWLGSAWGIALDYTHTKAYADIDFRTDPIYNHLEFTDGNNLLILNILHRWKRSGSPWTPYVGFGLGVAIPHVEVILDAFPRAHTWNYQLTGLAGQALGGIEYKLTDRWAIFGEAKLSYSHVNAELNGGGSLKTDLWSPQLALGISYRFGGDR